jgi:hypothetical protein
MRQQLLCLITIIYVHKGHGLFSVLTVLQYSTTSNSIMLLSMTIYWFVALIVVFVSVKNTRYLQRLSHTHWIFFYFSVIYILWC